jgi:hypothetical protein
MELVDLSLILSRDTNQDGKRPCASARCLYLVPGQRQGACSSSCLSPQTPPLAVKQNDNQVQQFYRFQSTIVCSSSVLEAPRHTHPPLYPAPVSGPPDPTELGSRSLDMLATNPTKPGSPCGMTLLSFLPNRPDGQAPGQATCHSLRDGPHVCISVNCR